jgi:hypothetical protein
MVSGKPASVNRKALKRRGPESLAWDQLKGKGVEVVYTSGHVDHGILVWVDRYTIGFQRGISEQISILFKSQLREVRAA